MGGKGPEHETTGDTNLIARNYALMRLEHMESSDLLGYSLEDLYQLESEFHDAQRKILASLSSQAQAHEIKATIHFDALMCKVKYRVRELLKTETNPEIKPQVSSFAKLPKISIKPFDGKLENWVSFKELYDSLIHKRDLPNVEKLHYLLSSVQGVAYDLVKGFPLCEESYLDAYQTLCKYYDKKRQIVFVYYEKLLNCDVVKNKSSVDLERVHRTFSENLSILSRYDLPDKDFMLFYLLWSKLDSASREAFELQLTSDVNIPKFKELHDFIEKRSRALENSNIKLNAVSSKPTAGQKTNKSSLAVPSVSNCSLCSASDHSLEKCINFLKLSPNERFTKVKEIKLCILCLGDSHGVKNCKTNVHCDKCKYRHHSLLHFEKESSKSDTSPSPQVSLTVPSSDSQVLFSTAVVFVKNKFGKLTRARILLDSASACNFVTLSCAKRLGLQINKNGQSVNGISQVSTGTLGTVNCEIIPTSGDSQNKFKFEAFVLSKICTDMPSGQIDISSWHHLKDLDLADPDFNKSGPIDMLVNVNLFASALQPGLVKGEAGQPIAVPTVFGWIVMGECATNTSRSHSSCVATKSCFFVSCPSLDKNIRRFWELENVEPPKSTVLSKDETLSENHMEACSYRNPDGRMVVPLTFVDHQDKPRFSNSREIALRRLHNLERKFKLNPQFRTAYIKFMNDYKECGHMEKVEAPSSSIGNFYYIPHHGVLRPDSVTTPLRTVFDASAKDADGKSLNETLLPGPKLQKSLFDLLIRFRWHPIVFTGDIKQMYRQFLVRPQDCDYQRVLWRPSTDVPVQDFRLLTVTYGVSCAPYQALWCISKLAKESSASAPLGARVLARDTYVDDVVSGADSVGNALLIRDQLLQILSSACLHLRKWTSNNQEFLGNLPVSDLYSEQFRDFEESNDLSLKILGLLWLPKSDEFTFRSVALEARCTKRSILSDLARIFDPLGFVSPVVFLAKYLMQLLWISGVDWDEEAPDFIAQEWLKFKSQLSSLNTLAIPRRMIESFAELQFHGFCDASERGYCAVVYCRVLRDNQDVVVRLCCAKSKVAPLRKVSIPRLELLAAVLLADLIASISSALLEFHQVGQVVAWSDSTVALAWIKSCPSRWKTFVANRVTAIQEKIPPECWRHVNSGSNPADCGSRGMLPSELASHELWWTGPAWLSRSPDNWPSSPVSLDGEALEREQKILTLLTSVQQTCVDQMLEKFSSLSRLKRVLSYCLRFIHNLRRPSSERNLVGSLQPSELNEAFMALIKHAQLSAFPQEINYLKKGRPNSLSKNLRKLSPFLDEVGVLRVGGRLARAELAPKVKHPILLPRSHRLTILIIDEFHRKYMHPGAQTLHNLIAQSFWILSPKRAIHSVISNCMKCFRANPRPASAPIMGNLPPYRVNQLKPFSTSVVDYGGPFDIALGRGRGVKTFKGYIAVFVCTATKAVHIELASELTTEAFVAVLKRFVARRGRCSHIISDQGRNFIGASNHFNALIESAADSQEIRFSFSPPGSPHFNGLAEAGIKSVKTHLLRVIGQQRLTFEEFYTVLTQIEAMLNSRPLTPLSSDANDLSVLTPGHFLTLEPLTLLPEDNLVNVKIGPLQRWKLIQQMHQSFWQRWRREYMHTLQQRAKWCKSHPDIVEGTLVLIINENAHPLNWDIGRIVELHPGADGVCRVVTVKTAAGHYRRPIVKLCPLPDSN